MNALDLGFIAVFPMMYFVTETVLFEKYFTKPNYFSASYKMKFLNLKLIIFGAMDSMTNMKLQQFCLVFP